MAAASTSHALVDTTDRLRRPVTSALDPNRRSGLGQFLTPGGVSWLMASLLEDCPRHLRLLDAGAGAGALTAAVIERVCQSIPSTTSITATCVEIEPILIPHLHRTLAHGTTVGRSAGVTVSPEVLESDFILWAVQRLARHRGQDTTAGFAAAILNPPYCKIGSTSPERRLLRSIGIEVTNLYAAFVALAIRLLEPGGQIIAIIPRSFCNGPYFRDFRRLLLEETRLTRIHRFSTRDTAFGEDGVLQENVIIRAVKTTAVQATITISSSASSQSPMASRRMPSQTVIRDGDGERFIHLPSEPDAAAIAAWMDGWPETLDSLGITVSTGRVVDFRVRSLLHHRARKGRCPLIYACHLSGGIVRWPLTTSKPSLIARTATTEALLIPRGYYTITKRFSSMEERRRLVAAVLDPTILDQPAVGLENHLNFFHDRGCGLSAPLAYGLMAYLNCTPIDRYVRQFNGHTQVNATDLRSLRYPSRGSLEDLGRSLQSSTTWTQQSIDALVLALRPLPVVPVSAEA